jgi:O-antigen ligase
LAGIPEIVSRATAIGGGLLACLVVAAVCYAAPNVIAPELGLIGIGAPLLWLVWKRPEVGLLGMVSLTAGLLPLSSLYIPLPIGGLFYYDVVLVGLFGVLALRALTYDGLRIDWWPVSMPILVFLALAVASVINAVGFREVDLARSLNELRPLVYYAAAIVVAMGLTRPSQRTTLLIGLFVLSDVVTAALVVQQFLGLGNFVLPGMVGWQVNDQGADPSASRGPGFGLVRIVPPANVLMFVMMLLALVWTLAPGLTRSARIMCAAQFAFLNFGLLLTYTRAQWIASVIGIIIIALFVPHALRVRLGQGLLVLLGLGALVLALFAAGVQLPDKVQPALEAMLGRATSIVTPDATLNSSSLQWRVFETEAAFSSLAESPQGVGLGNTYRPITTLSGEAAGYQGNPLNTFVHNSYLYIAVKTGVLGLAAFLWFCLAFLLCSWRLFRRMPHGPDRWLVLTIVASFVGIMQWSVTEANFMQTCATATVGLMVGLLASLTRDVSAEGSQAVSGRWLTGTP